MKKAKTFARRLVLNKETLRSLDERESQQVAGGATNPDTFCIWCRQDESGGYDSCIECQPS